MKFRMLVLEGDKEAEKRKKENPPPMYTKSDYLRRKRNMSMPPLYNRSFYLCRMVEEELKGIEIDGSGRITICAHQERIFPGEEKYICPHKLHISLYYLEQGQIDAIEEATPSTEPLVIAEILRDSLLDIALRNNCSEAVTQKIKRAFECIFNNHFVREERIRRLTKRSKSNGLTANVYRVLSNEAGEGWYVKITNRKGEVLCQKSIDSSTQYVDRLASRLYAKSEWRGNKFVILTNFGRDIVSIDVDP